MCLADLNIDQVKLYLKNRDILNPQEFLDAVEHNEAMKLISRPQDLEELTLYWKEHNKLGNRYELVENRVKKRCTERNPDIADIRDISSIKVENSIRDIAVLCSLSRNASIQLSDEGNISDAIDVNPLFSDGYTPV